MGMFGRGSCCIVLALSPCLACVSNTIEIETDASGEGSTSHGGNVSITTSSSPPSVTTVTTRDPDDTADPSDTSDPPDDTGPGPLDLGGDPMPDGTFLLAIETILSPGLPFQGVVLVERSGDSTVDLTLQWLSLDQGSTTVPREPLLPTYFFWRVPVAPDGSFTWTMDAMMLPAAANPITGSDVLADLVLEVVPAGSPYCGPVDGDVLSPIQVPLAGSTHALTAIPSAEELPLEFPVSCP